MIAVTDSDMAVRRYLVALKDPEALIDRDAIARLQQEAAQADDPLDKLRTLTRLERAKAVDVSFYAQDFMAHARLWAEHNDVSINAFRELGVTDDVLRGAGLLGRVRRATHRVSASRQSVRGVTSTMLQQHIPDQLSEFTHQDVMSSIGGSPMTVRKAVNSLVAAGVVERVGAAQNWSGPGRAPVVYRVLGRRAVAS